MKTLDEVIYAYERCNQSNFDDPNPCGNCAYHSVEHGGCKCHRNADALHYLQAYKDDRNDLTALRAYWKEQHENNPLTWDELREMEGKPIWVEESAENGLWWTYWVIWEQENAVLPGKNYGTTWQAYRKERK